MGTLMEKYAELVALASSLANAADETAKLYKAGNISSPIYRDEMLAIYQMVEKYEIEKLFYNARLANISRKFPRYKIW